MSVNRSNYLRCVEALLENDKEMLTKTVEVLLRIINNIIEKPTEEKYRSIRTGTKTFMNHLLPVVGAVDCLLEMGFVDGDDKFTLPMDSSLENLRVLKFQLQSINYTKQNGQKQTKQNNHKNLKSNVSSSNLKLLSKPQSDLFLKIQSHFNHTLMYEDVALQQQALSVIPLGRLTENANKRLSKNSCFTSRNGVATTMVYSDCILLELLNWFKKEFFTWTNSPKCSFCNSSATVSTGMLSPTPDERKWQAGRVEGYTCQDCHSIVRFPRYNHPGKLLTTRTGRCGEWANCFTLLCRAMKFDARHVLDLTDHVWTEVYSTSAKRWLHCDPCENICDKPLIYEKGWGKTLPLIIASSCDEIVDVTWRYVTKDIKNIRSKMFNEAWLSQTLSNLTKQRQALKSVDSVKQINDRHFKELIEFITPRKSKNERFGGRTTGSLAWRQQRNELGKETASDNPEVVIEPKEMELKSGLFHLTYCCSKDIYYRHNDVDTESKDWDSLVYLSDGIMRKEELDWKQVYLCRDDTDCPSKSTLSWKINLEKISPYSIKSISIYVTSKTFQTGTVKWLLCTDKSSRSITSNTVNEFQDLNDAKVLSLHAFLSGGEGDNAWQHSQLFRESLNSNDISLEIKIYFQSNC